MGIHRNQTITHQLTLVAGALAAASLLLAGCYDVAYSTCEQISADGIESLRVESDRGSVEVIGVEGAEVIDLSGAIHVHAASEHGAERRIQDIDLQLYTEGSEAVLTLRIPRQAGPAYGDLVLTVPAQLSGQIETHDGQIRLVGLRADQGAETTNGAIEVEDVVGTVTLETTNGAIEVEDVVGTVTLETTNGPVAVWAHVGELDLSTTNGSIEMEVVIPESGSLLAHTTNGPIDLVVPRCTAGSLMATTTNGSIDIEGLSFEGTLTQDQAIGSLGCGCTVEFVLSTTNGPIDLTVDDLEGDGCEDESS